MLMFFVLISAQISLNKLIHSHSPSNSTPPRFKLNLLSFASAFAPLSKGIHFLTLCFFRKTYKPVGIVPCQSSSCLILQISCFINCIILHFSHTLIIILSCLKYMKMCSQPNQNSLCKLFITSYCHHSSG